MILKKSFDFKLGDTLPGDVNLSHFRRYLDKSRIHNHHNQKSSLTVTSILKIWLWWFCSMIAVFGILHKWSIRFPAPNNWKHYRIQNPGTICASAFPLNVLCVWSSRLGQIPNFYRKFVLGAPLIAIVQNFRNFLQM